MMVDCDFHHYSINLTMSTVTFGTTLAGITYNCPFDCPSTVYSCSVFCFFLFFSFAATVSSSDVIVVVID